MSQYELKTKETDASVGGFLDSISDESRRTDAYRVLAIFQRVTGEDAKMWGPAIVGFGHRVLRYDSGRELEWMVTGFSPRKANLTLYVVNQTPKQAELLAKLGKHTTGKVCLYIKRLSDVDEGVLEQIVRDSIKSGTVC